MDFYLLIHGCYKKPRNHKTPNLKMVVTKMKSQSELNVENVTVDVLIL